MPSYKVEYEIRSLTTSERERERAAYASPLAAKLKKKTHFEKKKKNRRAAIYRRHWAESIGELWPTGHHGAFMGNANAIISKPIHKHTHTHNVKLNTQKDGRRIERNSAIANRKKTTLIPLNESAGASQTPEIYTPPYQKPQNHFVCIIFLPRTTNDTVVEFPPPPLIV